jgi:hypothetical protein
MKAKEIRDVTFDIRTSKDVQAQWISGGNLIASFSRETAVAFPHRCGYRAAWENQPILS